MNKSFVNKNLGGLFSGVSSQEKINFARNLSVGIKSGMSIIDVLAMLKEQTGSKNFKKIIQRFIENINNGQFLAQALEQVKYIFGDFFISIIKVGESSGNLSTSLLYLAAELKKQRDINHKVKSALIYPAIIFFATIGITVFLTLYIFPKILPIFSSLHVTLPFTTKALIWLLAFLKGYGLITLGALVILVIAWRMLLILERFHFFYDTFLLRIPFLSNVIKNLTLANFTRSLYVLLKSGITIVEGLEIAKGTFNSLYYRKQIDHMIEYVKRGESMARYLETKPHLFPPMFTGMVRVGETTGNLEDNLLYLSEYYESEVDEVIKNLTTIIEPILLLLMGLSVGFIALSIITPIYKVTQGLS